MHNQNQPQTPPESPTPPVEPGVPPTSAPPESEPEQENKSETAKSILSTIGIFILAPIIAIVLTAFVFQSYEVDGPSMETTLQNQDRLIVYKLPKTWARAWGNSYIPARGEIIVFTRHSSGEFGGEGDKQLIKRVIGVPGDRVVIRSGTVTVFNDKNPDGFNPDADTNHLDENEMTSGNVDITVDDGEVFVLGDNRDNSLDSRTFGPIKSSDISGELILRIYPFNKFDAF